ncbi:MAG TPA: hypothetical protein VEV17_10255 [Bryobacteraceae bacterium]|nr:hypothetical protein [Bryobacteraceae bacterium]
MKHRFLVPGTVAIAAALCVPVHAPAQTLLAGGKKPAAAKASSGNFAIKHTADGQPDIQGIWSNATITPFERPVALGNKAFLTEQEAAKLEEQAARNRVDRPPRQGDVGNYNELWLDSGTQVVKTRQTSLVVDPPDGRVPLTPAAEARRDYNHAHESDSYVYMSVWDRCITRGVPGGMFPAGYNNAYQIIQTPGQVVIVSEMIHNARVIPLDGSPHLPANVQLWDGDSRGHWEGNTLVVDTTNFNDKGWITTSAATGRIKGVPQTEALHVVERFTRTDADTLRYEVTVEDPNMFTQPWKAVIPLARDDSYQMFEYACHEGNEAPVLILGGGRAQEASKGSR